MFDAQIVISAIIFSAGMGLFITMIIFLIENLVDGYRLTSIFNKGYRVAAIIGLVISAVSSFFLIKYCRLSNSSNAIHERLVNDLDKAGKELQKFYIDHPEFKENEEWQKKNLKKKQKKSTTND